MAKFELKFLDLFKDSDFIKVESGDNKEVKYINIYGKESDVHFSIYLDKSTAIKFAKTLRTEINKITESEVKSE